MGSMLTRVLVIPFVYAISFLPLWVLHLKSSCFYVFAYYILGYRKKVVLQNLRNSFPDKSEEEIKQICKGFYKNFCDVIFETIKAFTISKEKLAKHIYYTESGKTIVNDYTAKKQTVVIVIGHCANWEWTPLSYQPNFEQVLLGVYHPLSNKPLDSLMLKMRSRFGAHIISMKEFYPFLIRNRNTNYSLGLNADQSPPPESAYWTKFLNQETAVFNGPAKIAKKFNYPVLYGRVVRIKRGLYEIDLRKVVEDPENYTEAQITEMHLKHLEENILAKPSDWLWSHRRWKHKRPSASR
jgi:KDO2-lipid IV(A) lauroyltransferase